MKNTSDIERGKSGGSSVQRIVRLFYGNLKFWHNRENRFLPTPSVVGLVLRKYTREVFAPTDSLVHQSSENATQEQTFSAPCIRQLRREASGRFADLIFRSYWFDVVTKPNDPSSPAAGDGGGGAQPKGTNEK